jgi:CubicO group peptidase (beta-lactamase class C family)
MVRRFAAIVLIAAGAWPLTTRAALRTEDGRAALRTEDGRAALRTEDGRAALRAEQLTLADELDQFLEAQRAAAKAPALQVAVSFKGQQIYSKALGMSDLEYRAPATVNTAFRTASVAKPITATAVMALVEAGRLDLDAPIQQYCPAFPKKDRPVTARLILGHQAGIRHYKPNESGGKTFFFTIEESLGLFKNDPLLHEPGAKYLYTTFGYSVLGCAIEGASGQPYEVYLRDRVWKPAGMTRTRVDRVFDIVPERARGYYRVTAEDLKSLPPAAGALVKADDIINAPLHDTSMKIPGGGLVSTAEDLVRFARATMEARLLKRETVELMWTDGRTTSGDSTGYGLGWGVTPAQEGIRRLTHGGNQIGASSRLDVLPEVGLAYAIMTNLEDVEMGPISRGIAQILRKHLMK